MGESETCA